MFEPAPAFRQYVEIRSRPRHARRDALKLDADNERFGFDWPTISGTRILVLKGLAGTARPRPDMRRSPQETATMTRSAPGPRDRARRELLRSIEVRILASGLFLALLTVVALGIGWLVNPELAAQLAAMTGLNLTIGRAAGMSFGYASGLHHPSVITSSVLVETIQVLVIYPLFVLSWKSLVDARHMQRLLVGMRRSAEANQSRVARYGMIGLFAFVFLPFWMTGPVVGSVIGFLIGLKARHNLPIVLSATYAAVAIWAVFFERMNEWLAAYGRYAAFGLVLVFAVAALAVRAVWDWKQNQGRGSEPASCATRLPRTAED